MKRNELMKAAAFLLIFALLFTGLGRIMGRKWTADNQERYVAQNMYALDKNSLDVLVLGSSQVTFGVSPVAMYDHSGISAYCIGGANLSMVGNYYWMLETCKRQAPQVIMLEVSSLFENIRVNQEQKSADHMRFSGNKLKMLRAVQQYTKQPLLRYLVPMVVYHSRWDKLEVADFGVGLNPHLSYRGQNVTDRCKTDIDYNNIPIDNDDPEKNQRAIYDYQAEYLGKIADYCRENGIGMVLFKTPKESWMGSDSVQVRALAEQYDLPYLDFNEAALLEDMGYNVDQDMKDMDHFNSYGATKFSNYLADYLLENYDLPDRREDTSFDLQIDRDLYEREMTDAALCVERDPVKWLKLLKQHTPFRMYVATKGDVGGAVSEEIQGLLRDLGLTYNLNNLKSGETYVGIFVDGVPKDEKIKKGYIRISATTDDGEPYEILTANHYEKSLSKDTATRVSLVIKDKERFLNGNGINILIYDQENSEVVEAVSIDVKHGNTMICRPHCD